MSSVCHVGVLATQASEVLPLVGEKAGLDKW